MVSTSLTGHFFAENQHEEGNQLLSADLFCQQKYAFPLSEEILNREYVDLHVPSADKKALLLDLKQPRVELLGLVNSGGDLHIFDKTHLNWVSCVEIIE